MRYKTVAYFAGILAIAFLLFAGGLFLLTREDRAAARLLREGNQTFAADNFIEALGLYQLAQNRFPELAEPFYNAANALYRQESYADAIAQLDQALQNNADENLAQSGFYNKGNAAYNSQDLEAAIQSYIAALLLNPADADAKYNLELALQQQQQEQEQEQEENQDSEENQENQENQDSGENSQENQENQENQDSSEGEQGQDESEQDQEQELDQNGEQEGKQEGDQESEQPGQPSPPQPGQEQPQNGMVPQPGERLTAEQARQLLTAVTQNSQTLQQRLQQMFFASRPPSGQDW